MVSRSDVAASRSLYMDSAWQVKMTFNKTIVIVYWHRYECGTPSGTNPRTRTSYHGFWHASVEHSASCPSREWIIEAMICQISAPSSTTSRTAFSAPTLSCKAQLKAQRSIGPAGFDHEMVHRVFSRWYRCNDDKLAVILRDSPDITIGDSGHYGSPCFQFDGVKYSRLDSPIQVTERNPRSSAQPPPI